MPTTTINLTGQALSKVDDTNVTLTLGGTPLTALLKATSLTLGWSGQLSVARGGTGLSALGTASQLIRVNGAGTALEYFTPTYGTGSVTSVGMTVPTGLSISGSPITTSGTLALSLTTGYFIPTTTEQSTWNAKESALTFSTGLTRTVNTITIDTAWAGQTAITTLGTIATGVWQGTAVGKAYGGTGVSILTTALALGTASSVAGQLTLQNATNAFTQTIRGTNPVASIIYDLPTTAPTAGQVLQSTAPSAGVATLSWATASSGLTIGTTTIASGTAYRVLYESSPAGTLTQNSNFTYNSATGTLSTQYGLNANGNNLIKLDNAGVAAISIGSGADASGGGYYYHGLAFGINSQCSGGASNIALGYGAQATGGSNRMVVGATADKVNDYWFGGGITDATATSITFNASGGSGSNIAGASFTLAGGKATGSGAGGSFVVKTSTTLGSGTTLQSLVSRLTISGGAVTTDASTATWADALNFVLGSTTGTKFGTATTQKLAFYNSTPIVQPTTAVATSTFVANTSGIVDDSATFGGYKISQIVKALQTLGLLA